MKVFEPERPTTPPPPEPLHTRYSEVNKSFDSFLTQKKAKESTTPLAGRAQFFQNRIEDKATGKPADYYHQMEKAMNEHKVYELAKVPIHCSINHGFNFTQNFAI